jgi:hypothetical protein
LPFVRRQQQERIIKTGLLLKGTVLGIQGASFIKLYPSQQGF